MTIPTEELTRLLPLAARACGRPAQFLESVFGCPSTEQEFLEHGTAVWHPQFDSDQCAEMNAALNFDTKWHLNSVCVANGIVSSSENHDGTTTDKLRAWREASLRAAAKRGEIMGEGK